MLIQPSFESPYKPTLNRPAAPLSAPLASQGPRDSVSLGSSFSPLAASVGLGFGAMGALPLVGAGANLWIGSSAAFGAGKSDAAKLNAVGFVTNLAGTGALVAAAVSGSSPIAAVGVGLLGVSALTAGGVAAYITSA